MKGFKKRVILLGLGHGLNDMIAGYFLGCLALDKTDLIQAGTGLFLYNLLAFGGQYPVALWLEKFSSPKKALLLAYGLNIAAIACFAFIPNLSIVFAGVASAIYHVAGGTVCAYRNRATNIGLFAGPGVAGLIAGGYFAFEKIAVINWLGVAALVIFLLIFRMDLPEKEMSPENPVAVDAGKKFRLDQHDWIMIMLLTVISLRSVVWDVFQLLHENNYRWLLAIAGAALVGKIAGGWLADRIGWRLYIYLSLAAATPLITFFRKELILFCIGVGLLQSGIPATTSLLISSMKGKTERSIGLSFGTAIMAGVLVFYTPFRDFLLSGYLLAAISLLMIFLLYLAGRRAGPGL